MALLWTINCYTSLSRHCWLQGWLCCCCCCFATCQLHRQLAPIGTPGTPLQRTTDGSPLYRPQARRCQPTILVRQRPTIGTPGTPLQRTSLGSVRRILAQLCPTIGTPGTPLQHTGLGRVRRLGATPQRRGLGTAVHGRGSPFQHASGLMTNALRRRRPLAPYIAIAVPKGPLPFQVTMWVAS